MTEYARADESSIRFSLKKLLLDFEKQHKIPVLFDRSLAEPNLRNGKIDKWIVPVYGLTRFLSNAIQMELTLNICTRKDPEGSKNSRLAETVRQIFAQSYVIGKSAIPVYQDGEVRGTMSLLNMVTHAQIDFEDQTKVTPVQLLLWAPVTYEGEN